MKKLAVFIIFVICISAILSIFCSAQTMAESESQSAPVTESTSETEENAERGLTPMNKDNIVVSLEVLAKGMVAIFTVIIIIIIIVKLLQSAIAAMLRPPKDE